MATFTRIGTASAIAADLAKGTTATDGITQVARNCAVQYLTQHVPLLAFGSLIAFTLVQDDPHFTMHAVPMAVSLPLPPPWSPIIIGEKEN